MDGKWDWISNPHPLFQCFKHALNAKEWEHIHVDYHFANKGIKPVLIIRHQNQNCMFFCVMIHVMMQIVLPFPHTREYNDAKYKRCFIIRAENWLGNRIQSNMHYNRFGGELSNVLCGCRCQHPRNFKCPYFLCFLELKVFLGLSLEVCMWSQLAVNLKEWLTSVLLAESEHSRRPVIMTFRPVDIFIQTEKKCYPLSSA